jgi:hypothetical protein
MPVVVAESRTRIRATDDGRPGLMIGTPGTSFRAAATVDAKVVIPL